MAPDNLGTSDSVIAILVHNCSLEDNFGVSDSVNAILVYHYVGSGTVYVSGTAPVRLVYDWSLAISWMLEKSLDFPLAISWNVGSQPHCYYQIQSPCIPPKSSTSTTTSLVSQQCAPPCTAQMITTILGNSPANVCQQLAASGWQWPIDSMSKSNSCLGQTPSCVTYSPVNFQQIPECAQFALKDDAIETFGMDAVLIENIYRYSGTGGVFTFGSANSSCPSCVSTVGFADWFYEPLVIESVGFFGDNFSLPSVIDVVTDMGSDQSLDSIEAIFGTVPAPELLASTAPVLNNCGCNNMTPSLQLTSDLYRCSLFASFLARNGFALPNVINLSYSRIYTSWQANLYFVSIDGTERWNVLFEMSCTTIVGGVDLGNPFWVFTMAVTRRTTVVASTKAILVFNASDVCLDTNGLGFDFGFKFNVVTGVATTTSSVGSDINIVTDNLGLFRMDFSNNPLFAVNISASENGIFEPMEDISPYIPTKPGILQFPT